MRNRINTLVYAILMGVLIFAITQVWHYGKSFVLEIRDMPVLFALDGKVDKFAPSNQQNGKMLTFNLYASPDSKEHNTEVITNRLVERYDNIIVSVYDQETLLLDHIEFYSDNCQNTYIQEKCSE